MLLLTAAYVSLTVVLLRFGSGELPGEFATFYPVLACAWGAGARMRATCTTAAERRRRDAAETRVTERTRIAPELHDGVFHHVTAMVVQVVDLVPRGGARGARDTGASGRRSRSSRRSTARLPPPAVPANVSGPLPEVGGLPASEPASGLVRLQVRISQDPADLGGRH